VLVLAGNNGTFEPIAQPVDLRLQHAPVSKFEEADPFGSRAGQHWTKRSEQPAQYEWRQRFATLWCAIERLRESLMKSTGRIKAVGIPNAFPLFTVANVSEGETKTTRALVCVERDAVMSQEPPAHATRIELCASQILILPASGGILLDSREQLLEPLRWLARWLHRTTTLARAISSRECVTDGGIKLDVLLSRLSSRTRRSAEHSSGADSGEEDAIVRAITLRERSVHCVGGRQCSDRHGPQFTHWPHAFHRKMSTEFPALPSATEASWTMS